MTQFLASAATNLGLAADAWSNWSILDSKLYGKIHSELVAGLPERSALPLREIDASQASRAAVIDLSDDYTRPIVVRGALRGMPCLETWGDRDWWLDRFGEAEVLSSSAAGSCMLPLREALAREEVYVAGAASIFKNHPELIEMVENDLTRSLTPKEPNDTPEFYQLFLGRSRQGTTIHSALTINLFRQIAGRKRWYFIPPDQTRFMRAKVYANGYAATSLTIQPHGDESGSPWFSRLKRYTVTLEPGDLMINPPWWWHGVENLADEGLVVGVPTRYVAGKRVVRIDPFKTALAMSRILTSQAGVRTGGGQDPVAYERSLIENRSETDQQLILRAR